MHEFRRKKSEFTQSLRHVYMKAIIKLPPTIEIEIVNDVCLNRQFLETGDIDAFTRLFKKYYPIVYAYVDRMMRDHTDPAVDADDITSETFTKAFDKREEIQEPEKLLRWLLKTARNLMIDKIRTLNRQKHLSIESLDELLSSGSDASFASMLAESNTEQTEANRYVSQQLIRLLSDKDREIAEFMLDGLSPREIAEAIDSTATDLKMASITSKKQIRKLHNKLRILYRTNTPSSTIDRQKYCYDDFVPFQQNVV